MTGSIWTRLLGAMLVGCMAAAFAAPAFGEGGGLTLHRDGSKAVPFVAHVGKGAGASSSHLVLHRDGSKAVPFDPSIGTTASLSTHSHDGFDWADAAVGAAFALLLVGLGNVLLTKKRRASLERRRARAA